MYNIHSINQMLDVISDVSKDVIHTAEQLYIKLNNHNKNYNNSVKQVRKFQDNNPSISTKNIGV